MEALAAIVLIGVPLAFSIFFLVLGSRETRKAFVAFQARMAARGFPLQTAVSTSEWTARGDIAGVPVAIEPYSVSTRTGNKTSTQHYTAIRIEASASIGRAGAWEVNHVPQDELGAMREQAVLPPLAGKFRVFAERPEDGAVWQSPEAIELLTRVGKPRSIVTTSGALLLVLHGQVASAAVLLRAAELLAAIHARRPASPLSLPLPKDEGWVSGWILPATLPIFLSVFIGVPLSCTQTVLDTASPIACEEGTHLVNRHTNKNPLRCVDAAGTWKNDSHLIPVLMGMSLSYYPLMFIFALGAALNKLTKEDGPPPPPNHGGGAYR
jgi:hypothetical protein